MVSLKGEILRCICFAFEAINLSFKKTKAGNDIIKIDISKTFDTLGSSFLL